MISQVMYIHVVITHLVQEIAVHSESGDLEIVVMKLNVTALVKKRFMITLMVHIQSLAELLYPCLFLSSENNAQSPNNANQLIVWVGPP